MALWRRGRDSDLVAERTDVAHRAVDGAARATRTSIGPVAHLEAEGVHGTVWAGDEGADAEDVRIGNAGTDGLLRLGAVPPEDRQYLELLRLMKP